MAWTARIKLDDDKNNAGVATAIWNEGEADQFIYSRRAKATGAEAAAFVADAVAALSAHQSKAALEATLVTALEGLLNG